MISPIHRTRHARIAVAEFAVNPAASSTLATHRFTREPADGASPWTVLFACALALAALCFATPSFLAAAVPETGAVAGQFYAVNALGNPMTWPGGKSEKAYLVIERSDGVFFRVELSHSIYGAKGQRDGWFVKSLAPGEYAIKAWKYVQPVRPFGQVVLAEGKVNVSFTVEKNKISYVGSFRMDWVKALDGAAPESSNDWTNARDVLAYALGDKTMERMAVSFQVPAPNPGSTLALGVPRP